VTAKRRPATRRKRRPTRSTRALTPAQLKALQTELKRTTVRRQPGRWNPDPSDVQRSVIKLVLSLVEFLRKIMERQALRRVEDRTMTPAEIEAVGLGLMRLEETVHSLCRQFDLDPNELNLELGPLGKLS
jgi:hypothetical protein